MFLMKFENFFFRGHPWLKCFGFARWHLLTTLFNNRDTQVNSHSTLSPSVSLQCPVSNAGQWNTLIVDTYLTSPPVALIHMQHRSASAALSEESSLCVTERLWSTATLLSLPWIFHVQNLWPCPLIHVSSSLCLSLIHCHCHTFEEITFLNL